MHRISPSLSLSHYIYIYLSLCPPLSLGQQKVQLSTTAHIGATSREATGVPRAFVGNFGDNLGSFNDVELRKIGGCQNNNECEP